jgi:YVTN family beta-propeller protein
MDVAMSPAGNLLLVANARLRAPLADGDRPASGDVLQTISAAGAKSHGWWDCASGHPTGYYVGLAFSPDGRHGMGVGRSRRGDPRVPDHGRSLTETQHIKLAGNRGNQHPWPAGIAVSGDGNRLYVAGNLDDTLRIVDPTSRTVLDTVAVGHLPYGVALNRAGMRAFVSNWGGRTVSVISLATRRVVSTVTVGTHPCAIVTSPTRSEVYVANGDSDSVSVLDATSGAVLRTIDLRPYANAPVGGQPGRSRREP